MQVYNNVSSIEEAIEKGQTLSPFMVTEDLLNQASKKHKAKKKKKKPKPVNIRRSHSLERHIDEQAQIPRETAPKDPQEEIRELRIIVLNKLHQFLVLAFTNKEPAYFSKLTGLSLELSEQIPDGISIEAKKYRFIKLLLKRNPDDQLKLLFKIDWNDFPDIIKVQASELKRGIQENGDKINLNLSFLKLEDRSASLCDASS